MRFRMDQGAEELRAPRSRVIVTAVLAIAVAAGLMVVVAPPAIASEQTTKDRMQIWQLNLGLVSGKKNPESYWKDAIERMAEYMYTPDILTLQEVPKTDVDLDDTREFAAVIAELNDKFAPEYGYVHGDDEGGGTKLSTAAVVFNKNRFEIVNPATDVQRWLEFTRRLDDTACTDGYVNKTTEENEDGNKPKQQVAVLLRDKLMNRKVVVASTHLKPHQDPTNKECRARNMKVMHENLERWFPVRRITIIGGDLNARPDDTSAPPAEGGEADPSCWYRGFAYLRAGTGPGTCAADVGQDTYYDTVWTHLATSDAVDINMCGQWTKPNNSENGSSCFPEGSNKSRIDYTWIRFETSTGAFIPWDHSTAKSYLEAAGADRGYSTAQPGRRYSDHRGVATTLRWCPKGGSCS